MIPLGSKCEDMLTKTSGIVTARAEYLTSGTRYLIEPGEIWYDELRLKVLEIGDGNIINIFKNGTT